MNKFITKTLFASCIVATMFALGGCGAANTEAAGDTSTTEVASASVDTQDMSYEELRQKYVELVDYTLFLEQEVIRLDDEVRSLSEQNDLLQRKLAE